MISTRQQVMQAIIRYKLAHDGCSPSIRNLCEMTGVTSTSHILYHLRNLVKDGRITIPDRQSRAIEIVGGAWFPPWQQVCTTVQD